MSKTKPFIASIPLLLLFSASAVQAEGTTGQLVPRIVKAEDGLQKRGQLTTRSNSTAFKYVGDLAVVLAFQSANETLDASRADLDRLHFSDALAVKVALDNLMRTCPPEV